MRKKEKHSCKENMKLTGGHKHCGNTVFFWGECEICGKRLVETFEYVDTRETETDKVVK